MIDKTKIDDLEIITFFQPIISIKDRSIVALEALSRFKENKDDKLKPINIYINTIKDEKDLLSLDIKLIKTASESFSRQVEHKNNLLLFLNISSVIVNKGKDGTLLITKTLTKAGISPKRVVLEILEENLEDTKQSNNFFISAKELGYSLALDDVGVGFSNLQRITQVKPNIIKLDISLISNLHQDYYKRKVFKSLTRLAHDIGSLVIAEGVEQKEETLKSLELGAGLVQGFYFAKPNPLISDIFKICEKQIEISRLAFKLLLKNKKERLRSIKRNHIESVKILSNQLSKAKPICLEKVITEYLNLHKEIDCIFIMDSEGIQITNTISKFDNSPKNFLFRPAIIGADQSLKPYYLESDTIIDCHVTEMYISQATGKTCRTFSGHFYNNQKLFILCVDYSKKYRMNENLIAI